jgi:hypothetical protein
MARALQSSTNNTWIFRREERVQHRSTNSHDEAGIPILDPAVQLLYMAKSEEPKNQHDFEVARPALDDASAADCGGRSLLPIPATDGSPSADQPPRT